MFGWILKKWAIHDPLPEKVTAIVAVSYGATKTGLTNASEEVVKQVLLVSQRFPDAKIFWGSFAHGPSHTIEISEKQGIFPAEQSFYIGNVTSTTDECLAIKRLIAQTNSDSSSIVIVAEECHSRRCRMVWKYFFKNSEICFHSIPAREAEDPENPMILQRNWRIWFVANIVGWVVFKTVGIPRMARWNFHQPTS